MANLTDIIAAIGDKVNCQNAMIAIIIVAVWIVKRHASTVFTPMMLQRLQERLDGRSRGAAGVLQESADSTTQAVCPLAYNMLAVFIPAAWIDIAGGSDKIG